MVEEINGGDHSIDLEKTDPNIRAIHPSTSMEGWNVHNLAGYAKYHSCGNI
jgi:hypothetical protein